MKNNDRINKILGKDDEYKKSYGMSLEEAKVEMKKVDSPNFNNHKTKLASKIVNLEASKAILAVKSLKEAEVVVTKDMDRKLLKGFEKGKDTVEKRALQEASLLKRKKVLEKKLKMVLEQKESNNKKYDKNMEEACLNGLDEVDDKLKAIKKDLEKGGEKGGKKGKDESTGASKEEGDKSNENTGEGA